MSETSQGAVDAVEVLAPSDAIVPAPARSDLVSAAPVADVVALQRQYHELCEAQLDESDVQRISGRPFRKKSAFRKLAVAFNVTCTTVERHYERDDAGRIIRAEVLVRATAPNKRSMDGLGICDRSERCCVPGCAKAGRHKHCPCAFEDRCPGYTHFSNAEHDIPATAMTRATNRACADLFGMGEVSAEEVSDRTELAESDSQPESTAGGRSRSSGSPKRARGTRTSPGARSGSELTAAAIEARLGTLPDEQDAAFREWAAGRNLPWPPTSAAVVKTMARYLDELEAAGVGGGTEAEH
jgi:hypothetical protein